MRKLLFILKISLYLGCLYSFSQMKAYQYKRKIEGVSKQWHQIQLPDAIFKELNANLSDVRIYGITPSDTIEVPYILKQLKTESKMVKAPFTIYNKSHNTNGYYYTFSIKNPQEINQIHLAFSNDNFDWKVTVSGSDNQKEWFTIIENYRLLSINNKNVSYHFTNIVFPKSKYKYYKLQVKTNADPKLLSAQFENQKKSAGVSHQYAIKSIKIKKDKTQKQTLAEITLAKKVPLNTLHLTIDHKTDFYRHYTLSYLSNRFKTEKGWIENYTNITSGVLNSLEENTINFDTVLTEKIKLVIDNQDNIPLKINDFTCSGFTYKIIARFNEKAEYYLVSGRNNVQHPNYDIVQFGTKIPDSTSMVNLANAVKIVKQETPKTQALFTNKMWLWGVMLIIIILLTVFSVKMINNK